jgi:hypothetical protein
MRIAELDRTAGQRGDFLVVVQLTILIPREGRQQATGEAPETRRKCVTGLGSLLAVR